MRVKRKSDGKWVEIPDGPTPEEEQVMENYKRKHAEWWMRMYDNAPQSVRETWAEHGRF